jgi:DNA-binding transcriptional LysR family regulator
VPGPGAERALAILRRLEAATGLPLATVDGERVALTAAGRRLGAHGVALAAALTASHQDVLATPGSRLGALRVGVGAGVSRTLLREMAAELARTLPALAVRTVDEPPAGALADGLVDAVVDYAVAGAPAADGLASCPLLDDPWVLLVPSASALAGRPGAIAGGAFAGLPLIAPRSATARVRVAEALAAAGIVACFAVATDDATTTHALVAAGVGGGAVLPRSGVDPWHPGTVVLRLDHLLTARSLRLWWPDGPAALALPDLRRAACATCARVTARRGLLGLLIDPDP